MLGGGVGSVAEAAVRAVKHSFQAIMTSAVNIRSSAAVH